MTKALSNLLTISLIIVRIDEILFTYESFIVDSALMVHSIEESLLRIRVKLLVLLIGKLAKVHRWPLVELTAVFAMFFDMGV